MFFRHGAVSSLMHIVERRDHSRSNLKKSTSPTLTSRQFLIIQFWPEKEHFYTFPLDLQEIVGKNVKFRLAKFEFKVSLRTLQKQNITLLFLTVSNSEWQSLPFDFAMPFGFSPLCVFKSPHHHDCNHHHQARHHLILRCHLAWQGRRCFGASFLLVRIYRSRQSYPFSLILSSSSSKSSSSSSSKSSSSWLVEICW